MVRLATFGEKITPPANMQVGANSLLFIFQMDREQAPDCTKNRTNPQESMIYEILTALPRLGWYCYPVLIY